MTPCAKYCEMAIEQALSHYHLPASKSAIKLLCMIAAHESGQFKYCKQLNGPAVGLFQMEPFTFNDICDYAKLRKYMKTDLPSPAERMVFDFNFAAGIARVYFLRISEPLPPVKNIEALSKYAKKYWNTRLGKATAFMYRSDYEKQFTESQKV